ncbi:hypothetical protein [Sandaracinus amylolyticus]|uniref:UmuC domain-containing protein n=1 Tax=Sandaracinus amylolyticus TaxID=927083 RepID=A0A0F6VZP2_9BACT|nr:hypothetical protein [Sandaracinus amylolyticus]AKF03540.1 hypothetical protein DB32_000689 [Sandaracinus amylolyticus]
MIQLRRLVLLATLIAPAACAGPSAPPALVDDGGTMPTSDAGAPPVPTDDAQIVDPDAGAPIATRSLALRNAGWGRGALVVEGHPPCDAECTLAIPEGETVTITAQPGYGQRADAWGDECAAAEPGGTCTITMDVDRTASVEWTGGAAVAARVIGGAGVQQVVDVDVASDGDLVLAVEIEGATTLSDGETRVAYGPSDCLVVRVSSDASTVRWVARTRGGGREECEDLALGEDDDVFVVGMVTGAFSMGAEAFTAADFDAFAARIDASGEVLWATRMPSLAAGAEATLDLVVHDDGHVYASGYAATGAGMRAAYFVIDAADGTATTHSLGGTGSAYALAIELAPDGDLYLAGNFAYELGSPAVLNAPDDSDAFVLRMSTEGAIAWARKLSGSGQDEVLDVAVDDDGNVYAVGIFEGTITLPARPAATTSLGSIDWLVTSFDAAGAPRWSRSGGGPGVDVVNRIVWAQGDLYVAGQWEGTATNPATTATSSGHADAYVVRFASTGNGGRFVRYFQAEGDEWIGGLAVRGDRMIVVGHFDGTSQLGMPADATPFVSLNRDGLVYLGGS